MTDTNGMREGGKGQKACKRINVKRRKSAKKDGTWKGPLTETPRIKEVEDSKRARRAKVRQEKEMR